MADEVPDRLLHYLRRRLDDDALEYAAKPERLAGGNETLIYAFELAVPPETLRGPLVMRLFREAESDRARFEAAVQNGLAAAGYPAPEAPLAEDDPTPLGNAFLLMRRVQGQMLGETIFELSAQGNVRTSFSLGAARGYFDVVHRLTDAQARLHALDPEPVLEAVLSMGRSRESAGFEGRIEWARERIDGARLEGLRPGLAWLETRRPPPAERICVCHGDFNPNNLLVGDDGDVAGVLDWTHTSFADPALDVAYMKTAFETVPVRLLGLRRVGRLAQRAFAARYLASYERHRRLDREALRYFGALRCLEILAYRGAHQRAGVETPDAWNGPDGEANLIAHARELTGLSLRMPAAD